MGEGRGFYYHFVSFPGLGCSTLCRLFLYLKVKILSFFIRTGYLRTRGQVEHSGLAQMPVVTQVCCAPATWGCTNAHLPGLQASYRSPAPLWILPGNCRYLNMKSEAQCPHRPLLSLDSPESEFRGGRVQVARAQDPRSPIWTLSQYLPQATLQAPCPQHPLLPAQALHPRAPGGSGGSSSH